MLESSQIDAVFVRATAGKTRGAECRMQDAKDKNGKQEE
jgi:hypothetical protein